MPASGCPQTCAWRKLLNHFAERVHLLLGRPLPQIGEKLFGFFLIIADAAIRGRDLALGGNGKQPTANHNCAEQPHRSPLPSETILRPASDICFEHVHRLRV